MKAKNLAVLGLQWGDEGKGKIVNFLSDRADAACRLSLIHISEPTRPY